MVNCTPSNRNKATSSLTYFWVKLDNYEHLGIHEHSLKYKFSRINMGELLVTMRLISIILLAGCKTVKTGRSNTSSIIKLSEKL